MVSGTRAERLAPTLPRAAAEGAAWRGIVPRPARLGQRTAAVASAGKLA